MLYDFTGEEKNGVSRVGYADDCSGFETLSDEQCLLVQACFWLTIWDSSEHVKIASYVSRRQIRGICCWLCCSLQSFMKHILRLGKGLNEFLPQRQKEEQTLGRGARGWDDDNKSACQRLLFVSKKYDKPFRNSHMWGVCGSNGTSSP